MLSKNKIKLITSLAYKKNRDETGLFVAEGFKIVEELSLSFECEFIVYQTDKVNEIESITSTERIPVSEDILKKISGQKTPQGVLGVFRKKTTSQINDQLLKTQLCLALDDIQDPGNLGTIIRLADWFGIKHIFCSKSTADNYGSKVVQATMGALARVEVHYVDLSEFLSTNKNIPIYGTFLEGESIYSANLSTAGIIVMGNEGKGISEAVANTIIHKITIPAFPAGNLTSESLNVAIATAIVCSEFRRR
ncbi:RNA methyltransferase [Paludibacter sp.]